MRRSFSLIAGLALAPLVPRLAHAGDARAKISCSVDSSPKSIKPGAATAMGKELHCMVSPNTAKLPGAAQAHARAWITFAGQAGAPRKVTADSLVAEGDAAFFQLEGFTRGGDFKGCADFVVHAEIADDKAVLWSGDLPIKTKCAPVKQVAGKMTCDYTAADSTVFKWPGNGAKVKPRLTESAGVHCGYLTQDQKTDGVAMRFWIGKGAAKDATLSCTPGGCFAEATFTPGDYEECSLFTIEAAASDADGRESLHVKQKIDQSCPD